MTVRTLGIEEELLLVDPTTRQVSSRSHEVIKRFREHGAGRDHAVRATVATDELDQELFLHQVETRTDPTDDLAGRAGAGGRGPAYGGRGGAGRRPGAGRLRGGADGRLRAGGDPQRPLPGHGRDVRRDRPHRRHLRHARARRHRLRRGGRAGDRPAGALAAGHPRDQRELAVLRGTRHRLRARGARRCGAAGRAPGRPSRSGRSRATGRSPRSWSSSAPPGTRGCSTTTPGCRWTTRPSRSGCRTSAPTRPPACWSRRWSAGSSRPPRPPTRPRTPWRVEMLRAAQWRASRYGVSERLVHPLERTPKPAREVVQSLVDTVRARARGGRRRRLRDRGGRDRAAGRRRGPPAGGVRAQRRRRGRRRRPGRPHRGDLGVALTAGRW